MSSNPDRRRLFLALWPNAVERGKMAAVARRICGERCVHPDNLHLTLVFLGATDAERLACYRRALENLVVPKRVLTLDRLVHRRKQRMLWLAASQPPAALVKLVEDLNRRLENCGFIRESRPFQAHVTLARGFSGPTPAEFAFEPFSWTTDRVVLAESMNQADGVRYRVLHRWS